MKDSQQGVYLPVVEPSADYAQSRSSNRVQVARRAGLCLLVGAALVHILQPLGSLPWHRHTPTNGIRWNKCGDRMECTTIRAPLDWHNRSDSRTVQIAVAKHRADPAVERLGSIFINPGGPGGSGSAFAHLAGPLMDKISGGHYDIIGFDPRGINETRPYVSCFENALDEHLFQITAPTSIDLPVNFSASLPGSSPDPQSVVNHLQAQVRAMESTFGALYQKCEARSGEPLAFVGTEAVVRDIDHIARLIDGPEGRINFWGLSYGTIVGQYLTAILPAERIGKVVMDGVVDWESWSKHSIKEFAPLADTDHVLQVFADTCAKAGDKCALSSLGSGAAILAALDKLIDDLYLRPAPVLSLPNVPGLLARSYHVRQLAFLCAYSIKEWPRFADALAAALKGDHSQLLYRILPALGDWSTDAYKRPDDWLFSTHAIRCADQPAYDPESGDPEPTAEDVSAMILRGLDKISPRLAEQVAELSWCKLWPAQKKSLYSGTFEMANNTLSTPALILNQRLDPITPLNSALKAMANYGNNARLVEQNGTGHCAIGQASLASAKVMRDYWIEGSVPREEHSFTEVDEHGFAQFEVTMMREWTREDRELVETWSGIGEALFEV